MVQKQTQTPSRTRDGGGVDPAQFGDSVARQTEWSPVRGGGTNFRTRRLVRAGDFRVEFRTATEARIFYLVFLGVGLVLLIAAALLYDGAIAFGVVILTGLGTVFTLVGLVMLFFGTAPIVFDRRRGYFWKGRKAPDAVFDKRQIKHYADLDSIHALQLLAEYCESSDDKPGFYSYELNVVLKDGARINVVDHGNLARLREDAATLAAFLGKPVWDAA